MASLTKKIIGGKAYYYLRVCKRVDGKPKIVSQQYIGTQEQLIVRLTNPVPEQAIVRDWGAAVACYEMARKLDLVNTIDRHAPKRDKRGPSVGQYLVTAAINRCLAPCSKSKIAHWFENTVLPRLLGLKASQLTSQRFWDNMDRVSAKTIRQIERDLSFQVVSNFNLDLRCLLFDATNFFTFVDSFNNRASLPQWGHSKEGRTSLRILSLALLVTADGEVPLLHRTYPGNQVDSTAFSRVCGELMRRCKALAKEDCDITLIFDKGNNSKENLSKVDRAQVHFVGSISPTQHPQLLAIDRAQMHKIDSSKLEDLWAYRTTQNLFGMQRTVLVTYNKHFFESQCRVLRREINKRKRQLQQLQNQLISNARSNTRNFKPTLETTQKRINEILNGRWMRSGRHMNKLFSTKLKLDTNQFPVLSWKFNTQQWEVLQKTFLGKSILFTDRSGWTDEQIVLAYRSQHHIESAFRSMKNPHCLSFRPINHWTDQKLRVHAFYCVLALLILSLIRRQLDQNGLHMSITKILERLADVREITTFFRSEDDKKNRVKSVLSRYDEQQTKMINLLDLTRYFPK